MSVANTHMPDRGDLVPVENLIVSVLCRAHRIAMARNEPGEARAILHVALSFADELAMTHSKFDRLRFIEAATDQS